MKLFMCYSSVDQRICKQVANALEVHDVWYAGEVRVGQLWWQEILKQLEACEAMVYLLSPESVVSKYCRQEFDIAIKSGKIVIPILIRDKTNIPEHLEHLQYIDLSNGLTAETVKDLLNAMYLAEKHVKNSPQTTFELNSKIISMPKFDPKTVIGDIIRELENKHYENVIFLIDGAIRNNFQSQFIDLKRLLTDAKDALHRIQYEREAEDEYASIYALVRNPEMRDIGCDAFDRYREKYPDYDPHHIALACSSLQFPLLEWCTIPEGEVTIDRSDKRVIYHVDAFRIGKYPVTNAQFQLFIDAPDGYCQPHWWDFSDAACEWRTLHTDPIETRTRWGDHPRTNVSWFEAVAFARWLSHKTSLQIGLASGQQWQKAAQGDDSRQYPWGNRFDKTRCNMRDTKKRRTTSVSDHPKGVSPYGVMDMSGNVWEWCADTRKSEDETKTLLEGEIRGGSFFSPLKKLRVNNYMYLKLTDRYPTIGFRVMSKI